MTKDLSILMKGYVEILAKIKMFKTAKEELRTKILLESKTNDIKNFQDEENSFEYTMNKRRTFNKEKALEFIANKGDNVDDYFEETEYEMIKVKEVNKNE